jgi:hypothetical protein
MDLVDRDDNCKISLENMEICSRKSGGALLSADSNVGGILLEVQDASIYP